jgi:hypothetical protein
LLWSGRPKVRQFLWIFRFIAWTLFLHMIHFANNLIIVIFNVIIIFSTYLFHIIYKICPTLKRSCGRVANTLDSQPRGRGFDFRQRLGLELCTYMTMMRFNVVSRDCQHFAIVTSIKKTGCIFIYIFISLFIFIFIYIYIWNFLRVSRCK